VLFQENDVVVEDFVTRTRWHCAQAQVSAPTAMGLSPAKKTEASLVMPGILPAHSEGFCLSVASV
jgi:hypothetical protein